MDTRSNAVPSANPAADEAFNDPNVEPSIVSSPETHSPEDDPITDANEDADTLRISDSAPEPFVLEDFADANDDSATLGNREHHCSPPLLQVEFGRTLATPDELQTWNEGSLVKLDSECDSPIALYCGHRLVGQGELVQLHDRLGLKLTELEHGD